MISTEQSWVVRCLEARWQEKLPLKTKEQFPLNVPPTQFEAVLRAFLPLTFLSFAPLLIFFAIDLCFSSYYLPFGLQCSWSRSSFLFPSTTTTITITIIIITRRRRRRSSLRKNLEAIPGKHSTDPLQKTAILGTSHILRKVLQPET